MQIIYLALAFGSASAFVAPAAQAASSQLRSTPAEEIGVDPGPFGMTGAVPSGKFWEEQDGLARRRAVRGRVRINTANSRRLGRFRRSTLFPQVEIKHGRISMMAFLGMMVQELGITFPGSMTLDGPAPRPRVSPSRGRRSPGIEDASPVDVPHAGSVQFSDILKDGMGFPALENVPRLGLLQIVAFAFVAETAAMPATQYTGGPQNLPGGYDGSIGTIPGGYPFTNQIEDVTARNRALTCELQNGRGAMLGTFGAMLHSELDSCQHHFFYPITHN